MCCSDPPPPPDMGPMAEASEEVARIQQQTAREQLAWAREQHASNQQVLQQVLDVQLPAMQDQYDWASKIRTRAEEIFQPMEDEFAKFAQEYDTPERRAQERARAMADTSIQFDKARQNALQRLESYGGIDPTVARSQALDIGVRTEEAAAKVAAATAANERVENKGLALRADAINIGKGMAGNAAGLYAQSGGAGAQAMGGVNQTTATGANAMTGSSIFSNQALQGYGQSANIMNMGYGNQMQAWNAKQAQTAGLLQGIGGIAGMAWGAADGGSAQAIPYNDEGEVVDTGMGDGSGIDDTVPAYLSDGEYVIPADVVRAKGEEFFDKLIEKYHTPATEQKRSA